MVKCYPYLLDNKISKFFATEEAIRIMGAEKLNHMFIEVDEFELDSQGKISREAYLNIVSPKKLLG
jgi:hypothetical protein